MFRCINVVLIISSTALAGTSLEDRAIEVRAFIDSVTDGIETLTIPEDIHQLPQHRLDDGTIDPIFEITDARVALGKLLFHEPLLNDFNTTPVTHMTVSCATCHFVEAGFRAGQAECFGIGGVGFIDNKGQARRRPIPSLLALDEAPTPVSVTDTLDNPGIVSPSVNMVAYFDEMLWNGLFVTVVELPAVERQVRAALEAHRIGTDSIHDVPEYLPLFQAAFPDMSDLPPLQLIDNFQIIRSIAAYERTVVSNQSPWDAFLAGDDAAMTHQELDGAELFFGKANCAACHSGPALGSTTYHAFGTAEHPAIPEGEHDLGRFIVTQDPDDRYKFRSMTVRNLRGYGPFFHSGSAQTVEDVIRYKNAGIPDQEIDTLSPLFTPLGLSEDEILALTAFVADALFDPNMERFVPDQLPSGFCFPNNDLPSRYDVDCDLYGDADEDGDVDLADFADFQVCFGSEAIPDESCIRLDREGDEDIDLDDYAAFGLESDILEAGGGLEADILEAGDGLESDAGLKVVGGLNADVRN